MNPKYVEALTEIRHLAEDALIKGEDLAAGVAMKLILDEITATNDGAAGVRALPGCPSLVPPRVIPHDEPAAEVPRTEAERQGTCSCFSLGNGAFPIRRANTEEGTMEHVWIDGRRFTMEVVVTDKVDGVTTECQFTIRDNGQIKLAARYYGGKSIANKIAHKALKTYIKQLSGASQFHSRGGFLKQAIERLKKEQA